MALPDWPIPPRMKPVTLGMAGLIGIDQVNLKIGL
jgi:hypothetical protein